MSISLAQARRQVFGYRAAGWLLRIAGAFSMAVWGLRNLYELSRLFVRSPLFGNLYAGAANLIAWIYRTVPGVPTVWAHAPFWNVFQPFDPSNLSDALYVGFCFGLALCGTGFVQAGANLSRNIKRTKEDMQREQWKEAQRPSRVQTVNADTVIQTQIYLSSEDKWWTRPKGIVGLAIIGAVIAAIIAQWLNVHMGLAH